MEGLFASGASRAAAGRSWAWGVTWGIAAVGLMSFLAGAGSTGAYGSGDRVTLMERALHIPGHPSPGVDTVSTRFRSGSLATVLAVDARSGWLQIRGTAKDGSAATGWIVRRYVQSRSGRVDGWAIPLVASDLTWCPPRGSSEPHPSGRLRIATWNLHNLHAKDGGAVYGPPRPSVRRSATDYERIRCYVRMFDADILAVQEVDGTAALRRVVDAEVYDVAVSSRPRPPGMGGKQNTGFAFKKGLDVRRRPDFKALAFGSGRLRYGTRIDVRVKGRTYQLMSVHLKSGCFGGESSARACDVLREQIPVLERWIDAAVAAQTPFLVLGDFNRRFNLPGDDLWATLDDGVPRGLDLTTLTENMPISCRENKFASFVDHIVLNADSAKMIDRTSFRHITYRQQDRAQWDRISDHCPVVVELWPE